jgi:diguanylate cyclase (GGDEF)-like protein
VTGRRTVGAITLYDRADRRYTADDRRLLVRVAGYVAQGVSRLGEAAVAADTGLTDRLTGVPNARFLGLEAAHRISRAAESGRGFGLVALRIRSLEQLGERMDRDEADRLLCRIARRLAAACPPSETLVRLGPELFFVLTAGRPGPELAERGHALASEVEGRPLVDDAGTAHPLSLLTACATFPEDGETLDRLLATLDGRLRRAQRDGRTVLPFRRPSQAAGG